MRICLNLLVLLCVSAALHNVAGTGKSPKRKITTSVYNCPPLMEVEGGSGNLTITGYIAEQIKMLGDALDMDFKFVVPKVSEIKKYGLTETLTRQMHNNEVDFIPLPMVATQKDEVMDVTMSGIFQNFYILYPKIREENRLMLVLKSFSFLVWACIFVAFGTLEAVTVMAQRIIQKIESGPVISVAVADGQVPANTSSNSFKNHYLLRLFLLGTSGLMMTVLNNAYTTDLISNLTSPRLRQYPNDLESLSKRPDLKLSLDRFDEITQTLLNATSGYMKVLGDSLRQNDHLITNSADEAVANILKKGTVFIGTKGFVLYYIIKDFKATGGKCRYVRSPALDRTRGFGLGLRRGGKYNQLIEQKLLEFSETLVLDFKINEIYRTNVDQCIKKQKKSTNKLEKLKLEDLSGAFLILGVGLALSFFAFVVENVIALRKKVNSRNSPENE